MKMTKYFVKPEITHQNIGGKEFIMEEEVDIDDVIFKGCFGGNWACRNFLDRRTDAVGVTRPRVYYGKVGILGYIVAEDELDIVKEE